MNVALTGATGFIGSHVLTELVTATTSRPSSATTPRPRPSQPAAPPQPSSTSTTRQPWCAC
jgi:uncharacterized protein YbjT (DUF2867 family)